MVKMKTQTYKTNSPAWIVAFWSASFAMGSWIAPVGVLIVPAIAKTTYAAPPIVSGPGAWAWQSSTAVATARTSLWSEIAGNSPIPAHILSLEETGGG